MKTRFTELVGIKYPIMQGGMQFLGTPELAAAVSNAGGLGTINVSIYPETEDFRTAVKKAQELTKNPFAVNISLVPGVNMGEKMFQYIQICKEEGVRVIETAGRNPGELVEPIKSANIVLLHKCTALKHAKKAVQEGADGIVAAGFEVAGHPGPTEVGTFVLTNVIASELNVPVLAAGGIADGRSFAAALMLGASGVVLGTRMVASAECGIHQNFKDVIVQSDETDTILIQKSIGNMSRCYNNEQGRKAVELDEKGADIEEQMPVIAGRHAKLGYENGDTEHCIFCIGVGAGLIHDVKPVKEILDGMVSEAESVIKNAGGMFE